MSETSAVHCPVVADLGVWASRAWANGVQIETVPDLEHLVVRTRNSVYELIVVSSRAGQVLVRGGSFFPVYAPARLAGSSLGGSFLKLGGIYVGFQMELQRDGLRIVTTAVRSIAAGGREGGGAIH